MKLITTVTELEREFRRLTKEYKNYYWATAWASSGAKLFNDLILNKDKIRKIVVGIHFYQTHPDFIKAFIDNNKVRFIQQPEGTFHPKLYLFSNWKNDWELIIGSANFTTEAFSRNTEASILIDSNVDSPADFYNKALGLVKQTFNEGKVFNEADVESYRITWNNHRQKIKSLSGLYGSKKGKPKPIYKVPIIKRGWDEFVNKVRNETSHGFENRLRVIEIAKDLFGRVKHFNELTEDERKFIAGVPNKLDVEGADHWGYFGSMKGAGVFKNKIKQNDRNISLALDQIPASGQITKTHYEKYIFYYTKSFSGNYLATASRLLSMKRPDTFVCFDSKNRSELCKDFGIRQSDMDYERYWEDIIERIYDSEWWLNPNPQTKVETQLSEARAAFLDSLYYNE